MTNRAHLYLPATDEAGNLLADVEITVYEPGTTTPLALALYSADTGSGTRTNPFTSADGVVDFYLDEAQTVKVRLESGANVTVIDNIPLAPPPEVLQASLGGKAATIHTHALADVTGLQTALDDKASSSHSHAISGVTGLQAALDGKEAAGAASAAVAAHEGVLDPHPQYQTQDEGDARYSQPGHTHSIASVTDLQTTLDGKSNTGHTHAVADTTGLQAALDGKAATGHTHSIANVTGLQTALDGKEDDGTAAAAVSAHEAAGNPHPGYLTPAEGDAAYEPLGAADSAVAAHEAEANPHPDYTSAAELTSALANVPQTVIHNGTSWPARPANSRPAIFVGSVEGDAPTDVNIALGDIWLYEEV